VAESIAYENFAFVVVLKLVACILTAAGLPLVFEYKSEAVPGCSKAEPNLPEAMFVYP